MVSASEKAVSPVTDHSAVGNVGQKQKCSWSVFFWIILENLW